MTIEPITLPPEVIPFIKFALRVIHDSWGTGSDVDGGDIQAWGIKYGLFYGTAYDPNVQGAGGLEMGIDPGDTIFVLTDTAKQIQKQLEEQQVENV